MKCPRCEKAVLDERERNGVTVDVCPECRGVWLDRGELEKMLSYAQRELEAERTSYGYEREPPSSERRGQPSGHSESQRGRRKKSWFENIGDIFD